MIAFPILREVQGFFLPDSPRCGAAPTSNEAGLSKITSNVAGREILWKMEVDSCKPLNMFGKFRF